MDVLPARTREPLAGGRPLLLDCGCTRVAVWPHCYRPRCALTRRLGSCHLHAYCDEHQRWTAIRCTALAAISARITVREQRTEEERLWRNRL
jgi:hypothetical protein